MVSGLGKIHIGLPKPVLTLLLLEYGLGVFSNKPKRTMETVLTLLLLEYGLGVDVETATPKDLCVLTLLLLEYGLGADFLDRYKGNLES